MRSLASRSSIPLLALILLLAIGLRMYNLSSKSLWLDEGQSYASAALPFGEMLDAVSEDSHPPLYFAVLNGSLSLFGDTEFGMRLPSVVFSVLAVLLVFPVTRLLRNSETALVAALLTAVSIFQIRYAQEARMYSMLACLSLLSCWLFLRLYRKQVDRVDMIAYVLATTLLLYSHVYGMFILAAQNLYALQIYVRQPARSPLSFWQWTGLQALTGLFFLPWLGILLSQIARVQGGFWIPEVGLTALVSTFKVYAGTETALWLSVALFGVLLFSTLYSPANAAEAEDAPDVDAFSFLLIWLLTPIVLPFLLSQFLQPIYLSSHTIGASIAWYILVACGITALPRASLRYSMLAVLVITASLATPRFYRANTKSDWRSLTAYVDANATANDIVLFHKFTLERPFNFYTVRDDLKKRPAAPQGGHHYSGERQADAVDVRELVREHDRVWLVLGYTSTTAMSAEELKSIMGEQYALKHDQRYLRISVLLFEKKP